MLLIKNPAMAHLGHSGAPRGNEASFSEEMCLNHCSVVQKQGSRNSAADLLLSTGNGHRRAEQTLGSPRRGAG